MRFKYQTSLFQSKFWAEDWALTSEVLISFKFLLLESHYHHTGLLLILSPPYMIYLTFFLPRSVLCAINQLEYSAAIAFSMVFTFSKAAVSILSHHLYSSSSLLFPYFSVIRAFMFVTVIVL